MRRLTSYKSRSDQILKFGFTLRWTYSCALPRTTTPPSGVSVCTESRQTRFNCGVVRFPQYIEKTSLFESVSIWMKGGWKETRGLQRPISAETPVSESRMASLNHFETKRKKAPSGTSSRVCDVQVAERMGLTSNALYSSEHRTHRAAGDVRARLEALEGRSFCHPPTLSDSPTPLKQSSSDMTRQAASCGRDLPPSDNTRKFGPEEPGRRPRRCLTRDRRSEAPRDQRGATTRCGFRATRDPVESYAYR